MLDANTCGTVLAYPAFSCLYVFAKHCVDRGLVAFATLAEEGEHIRIKAQCDLLLLAGPKYCVSKKVRSLLWNVGIVDILISERINSLPVRPGSPFRILPALHDLPFSAR